MNDLIKMMEDIIGKKAKVKYIEKQKGDVRDTLADVSKARKKMDWKPKIDIHHGVREYIRWHTNEYEL